MRRSSKYEPIGVTHIGTLLAEAIGDAGRVRAALGVWPAWEEAVGPQIAAAARPVALRNGVLTVHVKHSVWMQELTAMRETLLRRIRKGPSARLVKELRFKVAMLPAIAETTSRPRFAVRVGATIPYVLAQSIRAVASPGLRSVMLRVATRWAGLDRGTDRG